jgi:hypothetical protein
MYLLKRLLVFSYTNRISLECAFKTSKQTFKYAHRILWGGLWRQGVCSYKQASRPRSVYTEFYRVAYGDRGYAVTNKQAGLQVCL